MNRRIPPSVGEMTRDDIARRTRTFRRVATRPRRPIVVQTSSTLLPVYVSERPAPHMTWKAARALVLEVHRPDRKPGARAPSRRPRPCQGGKLRPAPGAWWQARFADLIERRREAGPQFCEQVRAERAPAPTE